MFDDQVDCNEPMKNSDWNPISCSTVEKTSEIIGLLPNGNRVNLRDSFSISPPYERIELELELTFEHLPEIITIRICCSECNFRFMHCSYSESTTFKMFSYFKHQFPLTWWRCNINICCFIWFHSIGDHFTLQVIDIKALVFDDGSSKNERAWVINYDS